MHNEKFADPGHLVVKGFTIRLIVPGMIGEHPAQNVRFKYGRVDISGRELLP
jgi:hypothetical protein